MLDVQFPQVNCRAHNVCGWRTKLVTKIAPDHFIVHTQTLRTFDTYIQFFKSRRTDALYTVPNFTYCSIRICMTGISFRITGVPRNPISISLMPVYKTLQIRF